MSKVTLRRKRAVFWLSFLWLAAFLVVSTGLVLANNQWYCWHWASPNVSVNTAASDSYWKGIISSEFSQWDSGTCMQFTTGSQITGDAGFYGSTGWLGLARLLDYDASTCEIFRAESLANQSYLDGSSYDETDDRHVVCQEHGHTIGLDHRKGPRNQTCMNDTFLGFPDFDQHDADTVAAITPGCGGGGGGNQCANGGERGRKRCTDGIDNDGDGCIDAADPDCGA